MFRRPIEVALRHFDLLYDTFLRRSWVTAANQVACRDEYVSLLDYLRTNYSPDFVVTDLARDLIDFMINLEFLQSRRLLIYQFKLSCLCITAVSPLSCQGLYPIVAPMLSLQTSLFLLPLLGRLPSHQITIPGTVLTNLDGRRSINHCCLRTGKFSLGVKLSLCGRKLERIPSLLISLPSRSPAALNVEKWSGVPLDLPPHQ